MNNKNIKLNEGAIFKINNKGESVYPPSFIIDGREIYVTGKFIRISRLKNDFYEEELNDPETFIKLLCQNIPTSDIFTFLQGLPENNRRLKYYTEYDNVAAIPLSTYDHWLKNQVNRKTRYCIRKALEKGVSVNRCNLNDELVESIHKIFNETPVRQEKKFKHYGKDFKTVYGEMARDMDRSEFIGAYYKDHLIGFAKIMFNKGVAHFTQIVSKIEYREYHPNNALIDMAVRICIGNEIQYLTYGRYMYGRKGEDSLNEFKKHNGFTKYDLPRYYVPLNRKGEIAIRMKLHRNLYNMLPENIIHSVLNIRAKVYSLFK